MYIVETILLLYFAYVSLYSFTLSFAGLLYHSIKVPDARRLRKMAVLIPAYKEDRVIADVASMALQQNYQPDFFDVIVIADSLKQSTLNRLRELPIKVVEVSFEKSTKVKALNRAMETIGDGYDCAIILDADNVMERDFLRKVNNHFEAGYVSIQARRDPKNQDTSMALLDGLSETINNFIYRQGNMSLGLSACFNGSGMAFDYGMLKKTMGQMDSIGGFDRELEFRLLEQGITTYFTNEIVVFDEKVANPEVFEHQRKRWFSSQFYYLREYFAEGWRKLLQGNISYFNAAVLRNIQLPRLLNLGLLTVLCILSLTFSDYLFYNPAVWCLLLLLNALAIAFAIPRRLYNMDLLKSVLLVPKIFVKMLLLLFKLKGANKSFIHTPHGAVEIKAVQKNS